MNTLNRVVYVHAAQTDPAVERSLLEVVRCLDRSRFEPHVVLPSDGPMVDAYHEHQVPVHIVPMRRGSDTRDAMWHSDWEQNAPWRVRPLGVLLEALRPEVIHVHTSVEIEDGVAVRRIADHLDALVIWHLRAEAIDGRVEANTLLKRLLRDSDQVIAASSSIVGKLEIANSVEVIPDACDLTRFTARGPKGAGDERPRIGWIGRLDPLAGISEALSAFERIHHRDPDQRFLICGLTDPTQRTFAADLKRRAARTLPGLVEWHPPTDRPEEVYRRLSILMHLPAGPATGDRAPVEAQACGVPVVTWAKAGISELVVDGQTGFVVPDGDVRAASEAALDVARDSHLQAEMSEVASRHAKAAFQNRTVAARLQRIYENGLAARV